MSSKTVNEIIERRNEYRQWASKNIWPEWIDAWRFIKCRTKPIYKTNSAGSTTTEEDKSRTNVDMGLGNLVYRKNVARLSARPYTLRVIGGEDPTVAPRFSAKLRQDYDQSNEAVQDVRVRMAAEAMGIGIGKATWDYVMRMMPQRKALVRDGNVIYRDRASIMKYQGAPQKEIDQAIKPEEEGGYGADMSDDEVTDFMGKTTDEITVPQEVVKYEGPSIKSVFPGRIYYRPYVRMLSESDFVGEDYEETDLWLKKMLAVTYKDPQSGKDVPAFDRKAVEELKKLNPRTRTERGSVQDLEDQFRGVEMKDKQSTRDFPPSMRVRKRYNCIEEHSKDKNGRSWITWVSEDYRDAPLGRMPYPCDTYGNWLYAAEVPLPDLIDAIGDSTPRLMRFLLAMYNLQTAQNFDYVTQTLRKIVMAKTGAEFQGEMQRLGNFDLYHVTDVNAFKEFGVSALPPGAFERGSQLLQLLFMFEPSLSGVAAGTDANPLAGKTATTSILAAKAADVMLQFKMDGRDFYLKQIGMLKLWMYQKMAESKWPEGGYAWKVGQKFFGQDMSEMLQDQRMAQDVGQWALSDRFGTTTAIQLDPMEIQEDLQIEPESGSYMAVNDQLKQDAAQRLAQIAMQAPNVVDVRKVIRFALSTIPDIGNPDDMLLPEPQGPAPPEPKFSVTLAGKMEDQPELTAKLLSQYGIEPPEELTEQAQGNTVKRISEGADHATNLLSDPNPPEDESAPVKRPSPRPPKTNGKAATT